MQRRRALTLLSERQTVQWTRRAICWCEVLMNGKRLANRIVNECEKMGAEAVRLIDARKRTPFSISWSLPRSTTRFWPTHCFARWQRLSSLMPGSSHSPNHHPHPTGSCATTGIPFSMCSLAPTSGSTMTSKASGRRRSGREEGLLLLRLETISIRSSHRRLWLCRFSVY